MFRPKNVSQLIKMYLAAHEMTRSEFADRIGLSPVTLNGIINNKTRVTRYALRKLQPAFDREQNDLLKTFYVEAQTKDFDDNLKQVITHMAKVNL